MGLALGGLVGSDASKASEFALGAGVGLEGD